MALSNALEVPTLSLVKLIDCTILYLGVKDLEVMQEYITYPIGVIGQ